MGVQFAPVPLGPTTALLTALLNRNAGTYAVGTVSGGDLLIKSISAFVSTTATGLTSLTMATDNTTPNAVLASVLLAGLTGGLNLTPYTTNTYLPSGKHLNLTIVGNGTGGQLNVVVEYYPTVPGATIS